MQTLDAGGVDRKQFAHRQVDVGDLFEVQEVAQTAKVLDLLLAQWR